MAEQFEFKFMQITKERLDEDEKIYKELMSFYNISAENLTPEQKKRREELHRKYYIDNDDIRIYWQTY